MSINPSHTIVDTAETLLAQATRLANELKAQSICEPGLEVGCSTDLWTTHDGAVEDARAAILKLTQRLEKLVLGPHGFLHEYVSANWEYAALYVLVDRDILEEIPIQGPPMSITALAKRSGLDAEKLLRVCRLVACCGILQEPSEGFFGHTVISETLVTDQGFKSFVSFQLFETRVASTALSSSFSASNPYWTGPAAFDLAWGMPMYDWHANNPKYGKRFAEAMACVSKGLDPGNGMVLDFLSEYPGTQSKDGMLLVEVEGKTGNFSKQLLAEYPNLCCEVQDGSEALLQQGQTELISTSPELKDRLTFHKHELFRERSVFKAQEAANGCESKVKRVGMFLLRSCLWSLADEDCVKVLRTFDASLRHQPRDGGPPTVLVINDLVSPKYGTFEPNIERVYRRRDVTLLTMHNAKQRTSVEWMDIIKKAFPDFKIEYREKASSHSCRGLWAVQLP